MIQPVRRRRRGEETLVGDIDPDEVGHQRRNARNDEIERDKAALAGRSDDEARQQLLRLELRQAQMMYPYETDSQKRRALGEVIDRNPKELARLAEKRRQIIADDPVAMAQDQAAVIARNTARRTMRWQPRMDASRTRRRWFFHEGLQDPALEPNGCSTCANSAAVLKLTDEEEWRVMGPVLTPADAQSLIAQRYPVAGKAKFRTEVVASAALKGAAGVYLQEQKKVLVSERAPARVVMHEVMHATSSPAWFERAPGNVNEAMTEYFTRKLGYSSPGVAMTKPYEGGQRLLSDYIAANPAREDALAKAYFEGDFSALEGLEDSLPTQIRNYTMPRDTPMIDRRFLMWNLELSSGHGPLVDDEDLPDTQ